MLKTRVITALVLLAVLVPALRAGGQVWAYFCLVFVLAAQWEWNRLILLSQKTSLANALPIYLIWGAMLAIPAGYFVYLDSTASPSQSGVRQLQLAWFLLAVVSIWVLVNVTRLSQAFDKVQPQLWEPLLFLLGAWCSLVLLHRQGLLVLFSAMGLVWVADIGAYFCGKAWGKRKLAPTISPGKSWEGAWGGQVTLLVLTGIWIYFYPANTTISGLVNARFGFIALVVAMLVIGVLSVLGDLSESQLKRIAGLKDSSQLLPGHGGVLDRIDALIPAMPFAAAIATLSSLL
jgi:phosphatidate cytidylyltransferase